MDNNTNIDNHSGRHKGKVIAGMVLLVVGASLLLKQFDFFFFPGWLFSFPMWIIAAGLYFGANNNFRNSVWMIVVVAGVILLLGEIFPRFDSGDVIWPGILISVGIWLIVRRNKQGVEWDKRAWRQKWESSKYDFNVPQPNLAKEPISDFTNTEAAAPGPQNPPYYTGDEHLDALSIFGSVKKTIYSKNFQGGEVVNVFGGAEIDLTQADINGRVSIEITQIFGGVKMIVPSHWTVVSDVAAVFAGFDDKRIRTAVPQDGNKVLVLKGISIFAGVDIRSY
jgi:predicted membrane protein